MEVTIYNPALDEDGGPDASSQTSGGRAWNIRTHRPRA